MAKPRKVIAAGLMDAYHSLMVSHHQNNAIYHKEQAASDRRAAEESRNSMWGLNPSAHYVASRLEARAKRHDELREHHETKASQHMTSEEKRDASGRWTASMAASLIKRSASMSRRQHYEARRARQMAMGLSFDVSCTASPVKKSAASFSCPPKFHKLYASYSMSDDGQTVMKDGKPCSSRRAAYYAASAAKFHKLYASQAVASGTSRRAKYEAKKRGMASPNGQMPSSNPGFGDRNVIPFEAGVID